VITIDQASLQLHVSFLLQLNAMKYIFGGLLYVASVYIYCTRFQDKHQMTDALGFINTVATIILFLSPLLEVVSFDYWYRTKWIVMHSARHAMKFVNNIPSPPPQGLLVP
jgi:hypothetical protein